MKIVIQLTPFESDQWNWAQEAAESFWADDEGRDDGLSFTAPPVGRAANGMAEIENHPDVIEDMLYRLGEQLPGMCKEQGGITHQGRADEERMNAMRISAAAGRVAQKIEKAFKESKAV